MDIVFLKELRIDTVIGIYNWERQIRQTIVLDIEMGTDISTAAESDDIEHALNYKKVAKRLTEYVSNSRFYLVETLAEQCVKIIREEFNIAWVRLVLNKKGAIRGADSVGIIIERGNRH